MKIQFDTTDLFQIIFYECSKQDEYSWVYFEIVKSQVLLAIIEVLQPAFHLGKYPHPPLGMNTRCPYTSPRSW